MLSSLTLLFPKRRRSKENQPLQLKTTHFTALGQVSSRTEPWPVLGQKQSPCAAQTIQQGNSSSRSLIQKFSFCFASNARRTNPTSALKNHGMRVLISGRRAAPQQSRRISPSAPARRRGWRRDGGRELQGGVGRGEGGMEAARAAGPSGAAG